MSQVKPQRQEGEVGNSKGVTMEGTMSSKRPEGKKSWGFSSCLKQRVQVMGGISLAPARDASLSLTH